MADPARGKFPVSSLSRRAGAGIVLGGLLLVNAGLCAAFALFPPNESLPEIAAVCALTCVVFGVLGFLYTSRGIPSGLTSLLIGITGAVPVVMAATRALEPSRVLWGGPVILSAVFAAFFLSTVAASIHVLLTCVAYVIALSAFGPISRPFYALGVAVCALASASAVAYLRRTREAAISALASASVTDSLTGLFNRRGLEDQANLVRANAKRLDRPTVVAILDIDDFKAFNDARGHQAGDVLLKEAAAHWRDSVRECDVVARVGGDEFVIVLPECDETAALRLIERMRSSSKVQWSYGLCSWSADTSLAHALRRADARMYADKRRR